MPSRRLNIFQVSPRAEMAANDTAQMIGTYAFIRGMKPYLRGLVNPQRNQKPKRAVSTPFNRFFAYLPCAAKVVTLFPVKVIERESTTAIAPATMLVERTKTFIAQNACSGISVKDIVKHLPVSQRLAEFRYRTITGETMKETLLKTRLAHVKRLLASTQRPIAAVAEACGFRNPNNLAPLFKKRFGVTMSEWRTRNRPR